MATFHFGAAMPPHMHTELKTEIEKKELQTNNTFDIIWFRWRCAAYSSGHVENF